MCRFLLIAILVAPLAVISADEAKGKKSEKGFISLFDGKSLKGWKITKESPK
ncbi:MAG: hypothetical protein ACJAX6_000536, partial [Limisphaerales bacterium]